MCQAGPITNNIIINNGGCNKKTNLIPCQNFRLYGVMGAGLGATKEQYGYSQLGITVLVQ